MGPGTEDKPAASRLRGNPHAGGNDSKEVLRQRAREMAQPVAPPEEGECIEVIEFRLGRERLAFESIWVQEVFIPREIVPVPGAPAFIAGLVNLRGIIHSLVDLRIILGLPETSGDTPKTVLLLADHEMGFGILAERVETVHRIPHREITPPPPALPQSAMHFLRGVLPGAVSLLDAHQLLQAPQLRIDQKHS